MRNLLYFVGAIVLASAVACGGDDTPTNPSATPDTGLSNITTLQITDVVVGTGAEATSGRSVSVYYMGWLYSQSAAGNRGQQFDSNRGGQLLTFTLGTGRVIAGWDQGLVGMKVGGRRTLVIPPSLAYGSGGNPPIPGNATLVFDVELVEVR